MTDPIATTSTAPNNPTSSGPLTTPAAPAPQPAQPRAGVIEDRAFDALPENMKAGYARVKRAGEQGGAEWIERAKLPAEPADGTRPGATRRPTRRRSANMN
jgi:hypothetical protein